MVASKLTANPEPGGYLQWGEFNLYSQQALSASGGSPTSNLTKLVEFMTGNPNIQ